MSRETFGDPRVRTRLESHFSFATMDVAQETAAASWFGTQAIPDT
jgi:hypothetical protein